VSIILDICGQVQGRLNEYCRAAMPSAEDWVVLSNIVDQDGTPVEAARNKLVMFLANIQHDTTIGSWNPAKPLNASTYGIIPPPLYLNLYILFYANFSARNYPQGIDMISLVLQFFQANPAFNHDNLPDIPAQVEKIVFELSNLDTVGLNYLMGLAGTNYLPSAFYRVRMIRLSSDTLQQQVPAVSGYDVTPKPFAGQDSLENGVRPQ